MTKKYNELEEESFELLEEESFELDESQKLSAHVRWVWETLTDDLAINMDWDQKLETILGLLDSWSDEIAKLEDEIEELEDDNETLAGHVGTLMDDVENANIIIERRKAKIKRQAKWITRLETSRTELRRILKERG